MILFRSITLKLKYADDVILISTSKNCLQHCLDELDLYCDKWKLQINIKKIKIVLFNRQGSLIKKHKFQFKQNDIEIVREYKYLGFVFFVLMFNNTRDN